MNRIVRALIVWLVMLAVPFQAFAAAAALPCETAAAPAMPASAHDHHAMMMMMAATSGHHDKMMAHAGHAAHHPGAKCGSCPACWAGPALAPAAIAAIGAQPAASSAIPFDAGHVPTVHLSLPERPPRPVLA